MRLRVLAAAVIAVAAVSAAPAAATAAAASPGPAPAVVASGPHSDQCFGKGHRDGTAKPGAICWEGAICIKTHGTHPQDICMSTATRSGVHVVTMNANPHLHHNDWEAKLVGYVRHSMRHGHDWPNLGNPILNQLYEGYPVMNIHLVAFDTKTDKMQVQKDVCIGGLPAAFGLPAEAEVTGYGNRIAPHCSPVGQGKPNTHNTFMIWHPGNPNPEGPQYLKQILIVNYTRASNGTKTVLTAADTSGVPNVGVFDSVWYIVFHKDLSEAQDWFRVALHH